MATREEMLASANRKWLEQQAAKKWEGSQAAPSVIEEMHPEISLEHRAYVKNFANTTDGQIGYLKKKYPSLEFKEQDGRVLIKKPSEEAYKVLDPDTGFLSSPKELLADTLDIGYEVAAGVGEAAAVAGGALLGTAAAPGAGTLAGGALAGGAASAGAEAMRQKIGQLIGIEQDISGSDIALAGGVGLFAPLVLGAGSAKGVVSSALKKGYEKLTRGAAPKIMAAASGVPANTIRSLARNIDEIKTIEKQGLTNTVKEAFTGIKQPLDRMKKAAWERQENLLNDIPEIDITEAKDVLTRYADNLIGQAQALGTKEAKENALSFVQTIAKKLPEQDYVSGKTAQALKKTLDEMAGFNKLAPSQQLIVGEKQAMQQKLAATAASQAVGTLKDTFNVATKGRYGRLNAIYGDISNAQRELKPLFAKPQTAYSTIKNLNKESKQLVLERINSLKKYGVNINKPIEVIEAYAEFGKRPSTYGTQLWQEVKRRAPLAAIGMGVGGYTGRYTGGTPGLIIGTGLGGAIGAGIGGPRAVRAALQAGLWGEKLAGKTIGKVPFTSPYVYMPAANIYQGE
jgi:hypothetical protein